jgi:hypothetical protein
MRRNQKPSGPRCSRCGGEGFLLRWLDSSGSIPVPCESAPKKVPPGVKAGAVPCPACNRPSPVTAVEKNAYPD